MVEDEKEKEEERLNIHSWWCGGFHGMVHGYGVQGYKDTSYNVVGAQGCQGRWVHGTHTVRSYLVTLETHRAAQLLEHVHGST